MRRFLVFALLVCFTVPFGASLAGCGTKVATQFCNGSDSGPVVGQVSTITLSPGLATYGESLDYGQIGSGLSAGATDCKGSPVSVRSFIYATTDMSIADINPATGQVCAGMYNRTTGGGIPDYTTCNPPVVPPVATITSDSVTSNIVTLNASNSFTPGQKVVFAGLTAASFLDAQTLTVLSATPTSFTVAFTTADRTLTNDNGTGTVMLANLAYVTATAQGAVSNAIPVYIHPIVTSVVIGAPTAAPCSATSTDPSTNCCPAYTQGVVVAPPTPLNSCLSQGTSGQINARVYRNGTTNPADNITCQVGHLTYAPQNGSIFTVDQNGVATAQQPGSTIVNASVANSSTGGAAGFFATCPPASITLSLAGQPAGTAGISVGVNNSQPLTATVLDTNNIALTGTQLTYVSTTPNTIPVSAAVVTPVFPGAATINALCQPPTCNPAPFSQIGLYGNGKPITSNGVQITTPGTNASVLYIGSTQSQYILPVDFSTNAVGSLIKLPFIPNSMVITQDGSTIYLGSTTALMTVNAIGNAYAGDSLTIPGTVLAVSPDGSIVVVTDPIRQTVSLVQGASVVSTYGGVGLRAVWSADSTTVYIAAANNQLLVHSAFTGWYSTTAAHQYIDVTNTIPNSGAFFATADTTTEGRSYCATSTPGAGNPPPVANTFYPVANDTTAKTDRLAATNDGLHLLGATATAPATLNDIAINVTVPKTTTQPGGPIACTTATGSVVFNTVPTPHALTGIIPTAITGVTPATNSLLAFITYTGTSGQLPLYVPATGILTNVLLSGGATTAPVSGVFSTDNKTFFTGTSGDNLVHLITVTGTTAADTSTITPRLPDVNGNPAVPNLIVQRAKKSTS